MIDYVLFVAFPYVSLIIFFLVTIYRYWAQSFTYSSLSTQFLENQQHFWGVVPFHYGILFILGGHLAAFLFPREVLWWNSKPARLYILEVAALIGGFLTLLGLISILIRRLFFSKVKVVTSVVDWVLYTLLAVQITTGIYVAVFHPWGSSWFASAMTPYLRSLLTLSPQLEYVVALPVMVKVHIIGAFLLIGFFPFTRLVHILVVPNPYLWRRQQVVRWYRKSKGITV